MSDPIRSPKLEAKLVSLKARGSPVPIPAAPTRNAEKGVRRHFWVVTSHGFPLKDVAQASKSKSPKS